MLFSLTCGGNLSRYLAAMKRHVTPTTCSLETDSVCVDRNLSTRFTARCSVELPISR